MNMMDPNHRVDSVLIRKEPASKPEEKDGVSDTPAELEITREILSAIKESKPEKLNRALLMLIKMCHENYEEEKMLSGN